jgi:hypothetical protein
LFCCALLAACSTAKKPGSTSAKGPRLDLDKPEDNLAAFIKMRATTVENTETVYFWTGSVYSFVPGERTQHLFDMEAYNVSRILKAEGGYDMLTREVAIYRDPKTGKILEKWYNPWRKDTVDVLHVWNDPVNQQLRLKGRFGSFGVPFTRLGEGRICLNSDIFLLYPSPLKVQDFPENARSDNYQAAELFQFFVDENQLLDPGTQNVYSEVSWTRMSDFLPWMRMGDRPGYLVYQCRGYKMKGYGTGQLPEELRAYVAKKHPEFLSAPAAYSSPNMTSWRYFLQEQGKQ